MPITKEWITAQMLEEVREMRYLRAESRKWHEDFGNVLALADWLDSDGDFPSTRSVIYFFSKPWKWKEEYFAMKAGFKSLAEYEEAKEAQNESANSNV